MSSLLKQKESRKNIFSNNNISNEKNKRIKKELNKNDKELVFSKEKNDLKKKSNNVNISVKKSEEIKKIIKKDTNNPFRNFSFFNDYKKFDPSNKENNIINQKEKKCIPQKLTQKKELKNIIKLSKFQINQNLPNDKNNFKFNFNNKLSLYINDSYNISKYKKKNKINDKNIKNINSSNIKVNIKNSYNNNYSVFLTKNNENNLNNIKNEKNEMKSLNASIKSRNNKKLIKKNKRNYTSEKKNNIKILDNLESFTSTINNKKEHIKYSGNSKKEKLKNKSKNKKLLFDDDNLENIYNKSSQNYNSINNEAKSQRNNKDYINNLDIINIINLKEQTKKFSLYLNNTEEFIKSERNKNNEDSKDLYTSITVRKIDYLNNDISLLNNEKINNKSNSIIESNTNIKQSKWDKKYFVPRVYESLKNEGKNQNENKKFYKKINNYEIIKVNTSHNNTQKKLINFGDKIKKKREMFFNFNTKKMSSENYGYYNYMNLSSKLRNSFISKRNKHIVERNISIKNHLSYNYNSNRESDFNQQERKLELIHKEIILGKKKDEINKSNKCEISLDNISDYYYKKNQNDGKKYPKNNKGIKRFKTINFKVNSLNIKKFNNNNEKIVVKRGDLLNRLRNIKYNYSLNEEK